ncbi:MAG: beta-lactamase family protein [Gemmataceae bacterium]|nr:beta-lactamase family protein [Gemmataceae bacterium]
MRFLASIAIVAAVGGAPRARADKADLRGIDDVVVAAIGRGELPGAVVLVLHRGDIVYRRAFGQRSLLPMKTPMDLATLFDLASLTKPIATATAIMLLIEAGKLKLTDKLSDHLPAFRRKETEDITVEHLLLHTSGFIADNPLADYQDGRAKAIERLHALKPLAPPGTKFVYSDVGYLLLGEIVEKASGMTLDRFTNERVFTPLGMSETGFLPRGALKERAAPTQQRDGRWMQGEVHDPRAHALGGVAGHAGLFSTADDLAIYARMLLNQGQHRGTSFLKQETVRLMTAPRQVPGKKAPGLRTYGWDMLTSFSANRGEVFPKGKSFGHTGFTGTSLWLDPQSGAAVIFLSNRVHPDGKGNVTKLRGQVATIAGRALLEKR